MNDLIENLLKNKNRILVIGDIMLDRFIYGNVSRLSPEAPVPILSDVIPKLQLGGAANVCKSIVSIGGTVSLMGVIGTDTYGFEILRLLKENNISDEFVFQLNGQATTVKTRYLSKAGHHILRLDKECIYRTSEEFEMQILDKLNKKLLNYELIIISDYAKGFLTDSLIKNIILFANKHQKKVLVDPKGHSIDKYKGAYLIKPNLTEFKQIINDSNFTINQIMEESNRVLGYLNLERLLITCGDKGMILLRKGQKAYYQKAICSDIKDVSGAGDSVTAILAIGLVFGIPLEKCVVLANACAGFAVKRHGTSYVSLDDIKNSLDVNSKVISEKKYLQHLRLIYSNKKIVFTNGCFDLIHAGHIDLLKQARELGDYLIVGINSDSSVKRLKGVDRPIQTLNERINSLCNIPFVDWIIAFNEDSPIRIIENLKPDVLVKGCDYIDKEIVGDDFVKSYGGEVHLIPHKYFCSTTGIIKRINSRKDIEK